MAEPLTPTRYTNLGAAGKHLGPQVDRLRAFFYRTDPLADQVVAAFAGLEDGDEGKKMLYTALARGLDAVPRTPYTPARRRALAALHALFAQLLAVPSWVDWERADRRGSTHLRCGTPGGLVLACCGLPLIYRSPAGNKPLAFTKDLVKRATHRLRRTAQFAVECCRRGGMRPGAEGWRGPAIPRVVPPSLPRPAPPLHPWD